MDARSGDKLVSARRSFTYRATADPQGRLAFRRDSVREFDVHEVEDRPLLLRPCSTLVTLKAHQVQRGLF
jgi:hypothetical protein